MKPDYGITCLNGFLVPADILSSVVSWRNHGVKSIDRKDRNIPIIGTLNTLFLSSATVGECPLFRFRAALGKLQKAGWRTYVCPWPERVFNESIERACSGKRHLLQLSRTEECFLPTGDMRAPVTLQLITPLHRKTMQLLETAELIFSDEGFQVVRGYEHQFGIERREILFTPYLSGCPACQKMSGVQHRSRRLSHYTEDV